MFQGSNAGVLVGLVMIAISFIIFPIVLDGANTILDHGSIGSYTGLAEIASIGPLLVFVIMLFGGLGLTVVGGIGAARRARRRR